MTTCVCAQQTVIKTTVPLVLVPAAVTDKHGKTIDGLNENDFELLDNGKVVKHSLEVSTQPIALIVAVQTSTIAGAALAKIQKVGAMFEPLVVGEGGIAAILTYSDKVKVWQDFTHDAGEFTGRMRQIEPDGAEARMSDAVVEAVKLFETRQKFRRVLVIIGEAKDRGSEAKLTDAVTKAQAGNVTVYPVNYSAYKTAFTSRGAERFEGSGRRVVDGGGGLNLAAIFSEIGRTGSKSGAEALAKYTGGEQLTFAKLNGLEQVVAKVGEDLHSQYLLSFQADGAGAGKYHEITVRVKHPDVVVRTRPGYWAEE